ncbi:MAG TPA: hypothetical protein DEB40_13660 [Elusimicrobia bacterium]|nr:hypothetical protein [Elusimicrobiota bacterium]HBT62780.1 hypothetical protein [Elusimicrobiota bacterium]
MLTAKAIMTAGLALGLAGTARAQADSCTLGCAVEAVLERNPEMAGARYRLDEADSALREAQLKRLPSLAVNSSFTRGDNPVYAFGTLLDQQSFTQANFDIHSLNHPSLVSNFRNSLEIGVPLFTGFELQSFERLGRLGRDAAESGRDRAAQKLRYETTQVFLQVLLQEELARVLAERVEASGSEIESARKLKAKGLVLGSDYYAAQAALGGLKAWQTRSSADLAAARSALAILMGAPSMVKGTLAYKEYPLEREAELADKALQGRPELRQAAFKENMAAIWRRKEGLSLLPKVEAFAALETDTRDFNANPWNRLFGVRAKLALGDPSYLPRRFKAEAAWQASRADARKLRQDVALEVSRAWQGLAGARAAWPIAKDTLDKARQSLELFRPLYREGRQSILEVLRAEEGLARAHAAYLESLYNIHDGRARLLLAAGSLDNAAVREIERGLEAGQ